MDPLLFAAEIHDGKIYGRGTTDMKGAIAAYTTAAIAFAKDTNKDFAGEIYVDGVVHEECFEGVGSRSISAYVKPDIVVIGEASQCNLKVGQRGRAEIVVETFGKPCHSANPEKESTLYIKWLVLLKPFVRLFRQNIPFSGRVSWNWLT